MTTIDLQLKIPDSEVWQDIANTRAEIRTLRWQIEVAQEGITMREAFIEKLVAILAARRAARPEVNLEVLLAVRERGME